MMMGIDAAPTAVASAAHGVRKKIASSVGAMSLPQSLRQIPGQYRAHVAVGAQRNIVDILSSAAALQFFEERRELRNVALAQAARVGEQVGQLFQSAKERGILEGEIHLGRVQHLEDDHIVALVTQMAQACEDL